MHERLALRSAWSLLEGPVSIERWVERLSAEPCSAVAFCDRNSLYGLPETFELFGEEGIDVIIACELSFGGLSVFAFVETSRGRSRLCELLTRIASASEPVAGSELAGAASEPGAGSKPGPGSKPMGTTPAGSARFDLLEELRRDADGLVLATYSPLAATALRDAGASVYVALSPGKFEALREGRRLGLSLIALDDAWFLEEGDRELHRVLRAIGTGKTVGSLAEGDIAEGVFLAAEDMEAAMASWPEAMENRKALAERCRGVSLFEGWQFPAVADAHRKLRALVYEGAERRYGELHEGVVERIEYELCVIGDMGFDDYFLVLDEIVKMASRTCGRGSGAASIVAYCLGITNVDPIAYNLYFERFLNRSRKDPPDIDVDFAWDERDALIERVIEHFGRDNCARVANHNRFRYRGALRECARAHGMSDEWTTRLETAAAENTASAASMTANANTTQSPARHEPLAHEVMSLAARLEGLPRGLSMHCGGLVITPNEVWRHCPVYRSADGFPLLAWEKEGTQAAGLVKIDLLGNRSLAVIRDALAALGPAAPEPATWFPAEDPATVEALARGDSIGVFYIESPAMRQLQKKTGRGDFDHIVIHSSIIRPAANRFIAEYVRRLHGEPWASLDPRLDRLLGESYGILCYQEDVSRVAIALAGFDEAEADALRKLIAKKAGGAKMARYEERFRSGCATNAVSKEAVEAVWAMMLSFDGYSFCKPHSASYAMVSFQSAWLRVHHPAPFMAAVLSNGGGYYRPGAYVSEARRMSLEVRGPCINESVYAYSGKNATLTIGLMAISGLSLACANRIVEERVKNGPYKSLEDFTRRTRPGRDDAVSLAQAGALDALAPGCERSRQLRAVLCSGSPFMVKADSSARQNELFAASPAAAYGSKQGAGALRVAPSRPPAGSPAVLGQPPTGGPPARSGPPASKALPAQVQAVRIAEFENLGFLRDGSVLSLYARELATVRRSHARDLPQLVGHKVVLAAWPVAHKEVWTSGGEVMSFISFEDESALYETVFFPEVYRRVRRLLMGQKALLVLGRVALDEGAISLEVEDLRLLTPRYSRACSGQQSPS